MKTSARRRLRGGRAGEACAMNGAELLGIIYVIVRLVILVGLFYFAAAEVFRGRRKK